VAFLYLRGNSLKLGRRGWIIAAIAGTSGNVLPFILISAAEQQVDSGLAALIMGISPIVAVLVAPLIHPDEKLGPRQIIGAVLGFGGVIAIVGPEAFKGFGGNVVPQIALIAAALSYSFTALFSRRFAYSDPLQIAGASVLVAAILSDVIAFASLGGSELTMPSQNAMLSVLYLGAGPTALAALVFYTLIPKIGAGAVQQVNYVVPVLGVVLGILVLGEQPGWNVLLALVLTATAVFLVTRSPQAGKARAPASGPTAG